MQLIADDAIAIITILQEAEGEPYDGKLAVAEVIRNRRAIKLHSDGTVIGTCLAPYQFSGWNAKAANRIRTVMATATDECVKDCSRAWAEAQTGTQTTKGATFYYNPRLVPMPAWASPHVATLTVIVGRHYFFTLKARA